MKRFKVYIGHNNETKEQININVLKENINKRYSEIIGYTIYNGLGVFKGVNTTYDEETTILEILTDNLNYIYIEELCNYFKELFNQECILYTEEEIEYKLI